MRQQVLKALANPPQIFMVPYTMAVLNFVVQFIIFTIAFIICLMFDIELTPLIFLLSVIVVHMILAGFSKTEPQLGQIVAAKMQLMRTKIPRKLVP